jgi:hypothetical protein
MAQDSKNQAVDIARTYDPVGRCIYCPRTAEIPKELGDEHIIPLSFAGRRILPAASCRHHERVTTQFEDHCFKGMMETARDHMGLRGRQKIKGRNKLRVLFNDGTRSEPIPLHEHPSALIIPVMPVPTVYFKSHETEDLPPAVRISITAMGQDIMERARKIGKEINLTRGLSALQFYRLIAKIAHSFAIAELGFTFEPYLINLIETKPPMFASHLVGGGLVDDPPPGTHLHEIDFAPSLEGPVGDELIMVRVRLFANLGGPNHYAVVGSRWRNSHPPNPDNSTIRGS